LTLRRGERFKRLASDPSSFATRRGPATPYSTIRTPFIPKCPSLGLRVDFWVVDDRAEAARLLELGADGIMTNDPAAIRPLFA